MATAVQAASAALAAALGRLAEGGTRTPCQDRRHGDLWFSDDAHERLRATALCHGCPVMALCLDYRQSLDAAPRRRGVNQHAPKYGFGVWGGVDFTHTAYVARRRPVPAEKHAPAADGKTPAALGKAPRGGDRPGRTGADTRSVRSGSETFNPWADGPARAGSPAA